MCIRDRTKEGNCLSVYRDGTHYLLKHWFTGRECDVRKETEVLQSVRNLARLHQVMFWRDGNSIVGKGQTEQRDETDEAKTEMGSGIENEWNRAIFSEPVCGGNLKEDYLRHNRELRKVREYIRCRSRKDEFELLYLRHFEEMNRLEMCIRDRPMRFIHTVGNPCKVILEITEEDKTDYLERMGIK